LRQAGRDFKHLHAAGSVSSLLDQVLRDVRVSVAGLLRRARLDRGITQTELAKRAGVNPSSVSDAERNDNPSVHILDRYGRALGLTLVIYYHDPEGRRAIE
jgi:transcriptional regulator with XRE-family HTH domain